MDLSFRGPLGHRTPPLVSKKLREFARGQDCALGMAWCNHDPATVVLCHLRLFGSAGVAQKPPDYHAYHGCFECHRREAEAGNDDLLLALMKTQNRVFAHFGTLTPK